LLQQQQQQQQQQQSQQQQQQQVDVIVIDGSPSSQGDDAGTKKKKKRGPSIPPADDASNKKTMHQKEITRWRRMFGMEEEEKEQKMPGARRFDAAKTTTRMMGSMTTQGTTQMMGAVDESVFDSADDSLEKKEEKKEVKLAARRANDHQVSKLFTDSYTEKENGDFEYVMTEASVLEGSMLADDKIVEILVGAEDCDDESSELEDEVDEDEVDEDEVDEDEVFELMKVTPSSTDTRDAYNAHPAYVTGPEALGIFRAAREFQRRFHEVVSNPLEADGSRPKCPTDPEGELWYFNHPIERDDETFGFGKAFRSTAENMSEAEKSVREEKSAVALRIPLSFAGLSKEGAGTYRRRNGGPLLTSPTSRGTETLIRASMEALGGINAVLPASDGSIDSVVTLCSSSIDSVVTLCSNVCVNGFYDRYPWGDFLSPETDRIEAAKHRRFNGKNQLGTLTLELTNESAENIVRILFNLTKETRTLSGLEKFAFEVNSVKCMIFLYAAARRIGISDEEFHRCFPFQWTGVHTSLYARKMFPAVLVKRLLTLCRYYNVSVFDPNGVESMLPKRVNVQPRLGGSGQVNWTEEEVEMLCKCAIDHKGAHDGMYDDFKAKHPVAFQRHTVIQMKNKLANLRTTYLQRKHPDGIQSNGWVKRLNAHMDERANHELGKGTWMMNETLALIKGVDDYYERYEKHGRIGKPPQKWFTIHRSNDLLQKFQEKQVKDRYYHMKDKCYKYIDYLKGVRNDPAYEENRDAVTKKEAVRKHFEAVMQREKGAVKK